MWVACKKKKGRAWEFILWVLRGEGIRCGDHDMIKDLERLESR